MYLYTEGHSRIRSTGIYLPEERVHTRELLQEIDSKNRFDISYDWIQRVTGIKEKRVASPSMQPSDMAVNAAKEAMERAEIFPHQIDTIIYSGLTRDYLEPATANIVQAKLGADNATVFDISNACHGFMNGIHVMDALIATGQVRYGLVVTGEQGSVLTRRAIEILKNETDRRKFTSTSAALTIGDAGAAMIMERKTTKSAGLIGMMLQSRGQYARLCSVDEPISEGLMFADMSTVVGESSKLVTNMFKEFMHQRLKWRVSELARYFIHQVGTRVFYLHNQLMGIPFTIMPKTVDHLGNLITAGIPLDIHHAACNRELKAGDKIYISSAGSGINLSQAGLVWDAS